MGRFKDLVTLRWLYDDVRPAPLAEATGSGINEVKDEGEAQGGAHYGGLGKRVRRLSEGLFPTGNLDRGVDAAANFVPLFSEPSGRGVPARLPGRVGPFACCSPVRW